MLTPRQCGIRCRLAFGDHLKPRWGAYRLKGRKILFRDQPVFAAYSDFHENISQWFYGIPKIEWEDWQSQFLAILMKESYEVSYVLLDPSESALLLAKCGKDKKTDEKKINIRMPTSGERIYIIEWKDFPLYSRISHLPVLWPS
jgi:hypothetical protein